MKRFFTLILTLFLLLSISLPAQANMSNQQIEYFEDGSYIVTVIDDETPGFSFFPQQRLNPKPLQHIQVPPNVFGVLL